MGARFGMTVHNRGGANYLLRGSNNVISDRSGFKHKVEECKFEWNGFFVSEDEWEERQPLDFLEGFPDDQSPAVSRPETTDVFITTNIIDPDNP